MQIKEAIENLYTVFRKYTTSNMSYCDCGCIDEGDVKKLASKKLRELEEDDFCSYHGSALDTWGDIEHYKHFIPRILEVHYQKKGRGLIGLFEITNKLAYASWESWDGEEVDSIKNFILADWRSLIETNNTEIRIEDLEMYAFFHHPKDLFAQWDLFSTKKGLMNFVSFFYYNGTEIQNNSLKLKGEVYENELKEFITQDGLLQHLEKEFFEADVSDKAYAEKVSVVLQMLEQELSNL